MLNFCKNIHLEEHSISGAVPCISLCLKRSHQNFPGGFRIVPVQLCMLFVNVEVGSVFFMGFIYTSIVSKFLPPSNNPIFSAIQNDWYYCFLVPLTLPVLVVAVYFHWLSMKLFKHA
ncbi:Phosphatidylinositol N-acetylglucosaminyltransferase subunit Y [Parasponia andersonii]|uniref:Phosphatidylinositol N-acetylglucosaminyltransferase subunit Y n=1 Tax=Parasponia andersonii TaxID=3476 RepID=A0A2P5CDF6_PARAD|nr:Phosphatidylinositol N-acetylglucosaminyltransferase subunit Y [Parasponia andersonii]